MHCSNSLGHQKNQVRIKIKSDNKRQQRKRKAVKGETRKLNPDKLRERMRQKHALLSCPKFKVLFKSKGASSGQVRLAQIQTLARVHQLLKHQEASDAIPKPVMVGPSPSSKLKKVKGKSKGKNKSKSKQKLNRVLLGRKSSQFLKCSPIAGGIAFPTLINQKREKEGLFKIPDLTIDPEKGLVVKYSRGTPSSIHGVKKVESASLLNANLMHSFSPVTPGQRLPLGMTTSPGLVSPAAFGNLLDATLPCAEAFIRMLD